ncbi:MAG: UPF0158 family protein [Butyricicoccus sp.]
MLIDFNELLDIFQSASPETEFFYSLEEEELHQLLDEEVDGIYDPEYAEELQSDTQNYLHIPKLTDDFQYETMSGFVYQLRDGRPKRMLLDALDDASAFERFHEYASGLGLEDRWNEYFSQKCMEYLREQCADEAPDVEFV